MACWAEHAPQKTPPVHSIIMHMTMRLASLAKKREVRADHVPQLRQWCFRLVMPKEYSHDGHCFTASSGTQSLDP